MNRKAEKVKILSFPGKGSVIPHALSEIHTLLLELDINLQIVTFEEQKRYDVEAYIIEQIIQFDPDIILTVDLAGLILPVFFLFPTVKIVSWFFDNPTYFFQRDDIRLKFPNYFLFSIDKRFCENTEGANLFYSPWGAETKHFFYQSLEKKYDVTFVGHYDELRASLFSQLSCPVHVWGDNAWENKSNVIYHGLADHRKEAPIIYNESKIVISLNAAQLHNGISERLYNIMACGSFVLTNWMPVLQEHFAVGEELDAFIDVPDLNQKIEGYLENHVLREAIARRGELKIKKAFTLKQSLIRVLERTLETKVDVDLFEQVKNLLFMHNQDACIPVYRKAYNAAKQQNARLEAYYKQHFD